MLAFLSMDKPSPGRVLLLACLVSASGYSALAAEEGVADPTASLLSKAEPSATTSKALAAAMSGALLSGQTLPQNTPLFSTDMAVQLLMQGDGNVVLYNTTKVQEEGYNAASAIWNSGTFTSSPQPPYSLIMQSDCNAVAYSGRAQTDGFSAATAVFYSATFTDAANAPCNLFVSSTDGGSILIEDATGAVVYQEPVRSPLYTFQSITFTTCGTQGRLGPSYSACTASYASSGAWTANTDFFNVANGIQMWTVPKMAAYSFTVSGGNGSPSQQFNVYSTAAAGGAPAVVSGTVTLSAGTRIYLVVGQLGYATLPFTGTFGSLGNGGGGGGSYVFLGDLDTPLLVAGGGGGNGGSTAMSAVAANASTAPMGGTGGPNFTPISGTSEPGTNGQPGLGGKGGTAVYLLGLIGAQGTGGGGGGGALGDSTSMYAGGLGGDLLRSGSPGGGIYHGTDGGFGGGGGSGGQGSGLQNGGGGGGHSGGNGGGVPTTNATSLCRQMPLVYCDTPGTPVVAGGGTSFASSLVGSAIFSLGPQVVPVNGDPVTRGAGFVQVVSLG